jgi:hypothetical protein
LAALPGEQRPPFPGQLETRFADQPLECAAQPAAPDWEEAVPAGCPAAQAALAEALGGEQLLRLYTDLGLYAAPELRLPAGSQPAPGAFADEQAAYLGLSQANVSPLQLALAAAALNAGGIRPAPQLAIAVDQAAGWEVLPALGQPRQVFDPPDAGAAASLLAAEGLPIWQSLAVAPNGPDQYVSWYLGGTLPSWKGSPLVLVVLLEERDAQRAEAIGQKLFDAALMTE